MQRSTHNLMQTVRRFYASGRFLFKGRKHGETYAQAKMFSIF